MKLKRLTALLLSVVMLFALSLTLFACGNSSPTVMKVGNIEVTYNMLRYFVKNYMGDATVEDYEQNAELQQELSDNVYAALRQLVACQKVADEHDIKLEDEDKENIETQLEALKETYESEEAYEEEIAKQFGDERTLRRIIEVNVLQEKLFSYLTDEYTGIIKSDDPTVRADVEAGNFFSAEYLFVYCSNEDRAAKSEFAQTLHERIANGDSMAAIDQEYQTTYGLKMDYCNLPCFTYTEELQYFEDAVLALEVGELGAIVERSDGFLIVRRTELDTMYIDENFRSVVDSYIQREYVQYMEDYANGLSIEWKSKYEDLKLWEME